MGRKKHCVNKTLEGKGVSNALLVVREETEIYLDAMPPCSKVKSAALCSAPPIGKAGAVLPKTLYPSPALFPAPPLTLWDVIEAEFTKQGVNLVGNSVSDED